jgi:hypothetical protein
MIVVVNMKNVTKQGNTSHFRIAVPKDCIVAFGKKEIVESLRTKNYLEADKRAEPLRKKWKAKFKELRSPSAISESLNTESDSRTSAVTVETPTDYYQLYRSLAEKNLAALFDRASDEELCESGEL